MKIFPFRGVRPQSSIVGHLITRPYKEYSPDELASQLKFNAFSFLQILNPGYRYHQHLHGESRFKLVRNRYLEFKERDFLRQDSEESLYIYRKTTPNHSYIGIIATVGTKDYISDAIKKHENTINNRVKLFMEYLHTVGYNAEPVLMTYPDHEEVHNLISSIAETTPTQDLFTTDMIRHELWQVSDTDDIASIRTAFEKIKHIYIADGHHRSASSVLLSQEYGVSMNGYHQFMVFLLPQSQLQIGMYSRLVQGLRDHTPESLLIQLDSSFQIEGHGLQHVRPKDHNQFIMYLSGTFYTLTLRESIVDHSSPLSILNTQILYEHVLKPILGIKDLRNDKRLHYSEGLSDLIVMQQQIDRGEYDVGFSMLALTIEQIKSIADHSLIMPPKSTFIAPKLYSGLVIYEYND